MDIAKVYPSGKITASVVRRFKPQSLLNPSALSVDAQFNLASVKLHGVLTVLAVLASAVVPGGSLPLGLSNLAKSETPKSIRGQKGISSYGRQLTRDSVTCLERDHGRECLSFVTLTLPPCAIAEVTPSFSYAVELFKRWLHRKQHEAGLPCELIGVAEIQENRYLNEGGVPLHEHIVFVGRHRQGNWIVSPNDITQAWLRCCRTAVQSRLRKLPAQDVRQQCLSAAEFDMRGGCNNQDGGNDNDDGSGNTKRNAKRNANGNNNDNAFDVTKWNAATNIQRIKKTAAGYLSKYLSKGVEVTKQIVEDGNGHLLPKAWYICSQALLQRVKKSTAVFSGSSAREFFDWLRDNSETLLNFQKFITIDFSDGGSATVGWYAYFKPGITLDNCFLQH